MNTTTTARALACARTTIITAALALTATVILAGAVSAGAPGRFYATEMMTVGLCALMGAALLTFPLDLVTAARRRRDQAQAARWRAGQVTIDITDRALAMARHPSARRRIELS